jgi:GT2 family glycosyltransferase
MKISLIVPVYNGGEKFQRCLESVRTLDPAPDEWIVVCDDDTDGSRERARQAGAHVIVQTPRGGPAKARNLGAREATGDVIFFLDADCTVYPDAVTRLRRIFSDPDTDAMIGSYDDAPSEPDFLSQYKNLMHHYVHQSGGEIAFTFWGACGAIRRHVFFQLHGFDESYTRPCIEDIELGYRLRARGYRIRLVKDFQIKHLKKWTARTLFKTDFFDRALPWTDLILKSGGMTNDLNLRSTERLSVGLVGLMLVMLAGAALSALAAPDLFAAALIIAGFCAVWLLILNAHVYRFLGRKRGVWFALRAIAWHWFYFFYSGLAYGIGLVKARL